MMSGDRLYSVLKNIKEQKPIVHCITNYVTVNDCANILLAIGASPIMADDLLEVEEVTSICNGLVINIGTLNVRTIEAMVKAGKRANELGHAVVFDPVGIGASTLRTETALRLLKEVKFTVIRGNISEIKAIYKGQGAGQGVDASELDKVSEDNIDEVINLVKALSERTGAIIVVTGAIDLVADKEKCYVIKNGHPLMTKVTGMGCMLTAVIAGFISANKEHILESTAVAVSSMGYGGELAFHRIIKEDKGTGSFRTYLIDYMSKIDYDLLKEGAQIEIR